MEIVVSAEVVVRGVAGTGNVLAVAGMFGIGVGEEERVRILEEVRVPMEAGGVVLVVGASGAGKSTLLRYLGEELKRRLGEEEVWEMGGAGGGGSPVGGSGDVGEGAVVDGFGGMGLEEVLGCLGRAGLSDAFVLLRRPRELSEGQRYRYELARFFASGKKVLVADEFCATLDRVTAKVVAYQLGKYVRRTGRMAVVATTHEDLEEDLGARVVVRKGMGAGCEVEGGRGRGIG